MEIIPKELNDMQKQAQKEFVSKSLMAIAFLVMGISAIILLNSNFLAAGIAVIVISSLAIYQYFYDYRHTKNIFSKATLAIKSP